MLRFIRPKEPDDFATRVAGPRAKIDGIVAGGKLPSSKQFDATWREFKKPLSDTQEGKCGYCESFIRATQYGDVEHYRPKAELTRVTTGVPIPWTSEAPPPTDSVSECGYWWLAYEWTNYLFACGICNERWKGELFPVAVPQPSKLNRGCEKAGEDPLLLNPYGEDPPEEHLRFDSEGRIFARANSVRGEATITTCGLHRIDLVTARGPIAQRVHALIGAINKARTSDRKAPHIADLQALGSRKSPHAGMVRLLVAENVSPDVVAALWPDHR